jgi:type III restriction enzyme
MKGIDTLIINGPYSEPQEYWQYNRETQEFERCTGRRPAGYTIATERSKTHDDPGVFVPIELVNDLRTRMIRWRNDGRPGFTGITKRLWEYWNSEEREQKFFFCQLEAIETLFFLTEAPAQYKVGIEIPSDGGDFARWCNKMATGSGKTVVMSMIIAWQFLNKLTYRHDARFSKTVLIVAPGLTVKSRLAVLSPSHTKNYYQSFDIVPSDLFDRLRQGKLKIINWHALLPLKEQQKSVVKKGAESDEAFVRRVLEEISDQKRIFVINDEAHHAWRKGADEKLTGEAKTEAEEATRWMEGLDRIHKQREIIQCFDLSATPFRPTGKKSGDEFLFSWIVSDFGLSDAIESGLVKTPRVVVRDDTNVDTNTLKPKLYHIFKDDTVQDDFNNRGAQNTDPLPDLVRNAYILLGADWEKTKARWEQEGHAIPPVMITVCNNTTTAARIEHACARNVFEIEGLRDSDNTLRIDSSVLSLAEEKDERDTSTFSGKTKTEYRQKLERIVEKVSSLPEHEKQKLLQLKDEELLRLCVDTVGEPRNLGEQVRHVIAVAMLSEGWDTKTVTHIMGLRAFSSQLLCEQVVGRGLRRVDYQVNPQTGFFDAEYVNIFGVPFSFLPHESSDGTPPPPPSPKTRIEAISEKKEFEIFFPNILRIEHTLKPILEVDIEKIEPLIIKSSEVATIAELQEVIDSKPARNLETMTTIDLQEIADQFRLQRIIFKSSGDIVESLLPDWKGSRESLMMQILTIIESFLRSDKLHFSSLFDQDPLRKNVLFMLNMTTIVNHIRNSVQFEPKNVEKMELVFDKEKPIRSTSDMPVWFTSKPTEKTLKSHISHLVADSSWELSEAIALDRSEFVKAWAKNDHLGFEIPYLFNGVVRKYRPDFLICLSNGKILLLEVKGKDSLRVQKKNGTWKNG